MCSCVLWPFPNAAGFSEFVKTITVEYHVPGYVILIAIVAMYIILGCFIDVMAAILLTIGILYPVIVQLGYSPIWFGVIVVRLMEIGMVTPPFGLNLFAIARTTGEPMGVCTEAWRPLSWRTCCT